MIDSSLGLASLPLDQRALLEQRLVKNRSGRPRPPRIPRRTGDGPFPLSFAQQRLWFLEQLAPGSAAYHIPLALRARGPLELPALQRALDGVAARHEALRTNFVAAGGEPAQFVRPAGPVPVQTFDLRALTEDAREAEMRRLFLAESSRPFDLARDLLLRAAVARLADDDYGLLFVMHHIAADGWSTAPFARELGALYEASLAGRPAALPELQVQYGDFALWQRDLIKGDVLERELGYWRKHLDGITPLELPLDHPRPAVKSTRGGSESLEFSPELPAALNALCRDEGVTPFMTLLAAFQALLGRYTGQTDVSVGSPIAGRNRVEIEPLIGFFVNTLVLRTDLSGRPTFRQLVGRVREVALGAFAHQDVPFEKLVEELAPERDTSRSPLFQVLFVVQNTPKEPLRLPGLVLSRLPVDYRSAKFDLQMTLSEVGGDFRATLVYDRDLFEETTVRRLLGHYCSLVEAAVANPDRPIATLPLMAPQERRQVVSGWNDTARSYPQGRCVQDLVEAQVRQTPDAEAAVFGEERLTYRELNARANRLAHTLRGLGAGPGSLVGLCVERSLDMIVGTLGILKAGAAYVPLDPNYPAERLAVMIEDAGLAMVVTQEEPGSRLPATGALLLRLGADGDRIGRAPADDPPHAAGPENLAYVIYTSGSTGRPKGVAMPHRPLVNLIAWQHEAWARPGAAATLQFASLSFDVSFQEIFCTLSSGGTLHIADDAARHDPAALAVLLARTEVRRAYLPPVVLQHLAEGAERLGRYPLALEEIITAGEQLRITRQVAGLLRRLPGCVLQNHYGPTETHVVTSFRLEGAPEGWPALPPIGRPVANAQIYLLDAEGQPVPPGVAGELYIGGAGLACGYLNRPALTAERFVPNPFAAEPGARLYRTGDVARYRADGTIEYLGRADHQVKVRGFRIELGEVEAVLRQHPAVGEAVVVARDDRPGDRRLVAYVTAQNGHAAPAADLRGFLRERLPGYMVPAAFVTLDRLPVTPNGKVDRKALPAPDTDATAAEEGAVGPRNALEVHLALIWEGILGTRGFGVTDSFFDVGGHSLLAVRLVAEIERATGQKVPLASLFQAPTIERLAQLLRSGVGSSPWPTLIPVKHCGSRPPLFLVAKPSVNPLGYVFLARHIGADQPVYVLQSHYREEGSTPYTRAEYEATAREYIREIRAVQPAGPYLLAGMCEGAHIAFEMTRLLQADAQKVALLGLFDTWTVENSCNYFMWYVKVWHRKLRRFLRLSRGEKGQALKKLGSYLLRLSGVFSRQARRRRRDGLHNFQSRYWPGKDFVPPTVAGKISVFRIRKQPYWRTGDRALGWGNRAQGGAEVHEIPGTHATLLREPHVQVLARKLAACIDNALSADDAPTPEARR